MTTGILRIQAFAARKSAPVEGVRIAITGDGFAAVRHTDAQGNAEDVTTRPRPAAYRWKNKTRPSGRMQCAVLRHPSRVTALCASRGCRSSRGR